MVNARYSGSGRTRLVFLHLPKTGGTTLHDRIAAAFEPHEICPERFGGLHRYGTEELARYKFFSGHYHFDEVARIPGEKFVFTVLRPPKERILSLYYFWRRHRAEIVEARALAGPRIARERDLLTFLRSESEPPRSAIDNFMACRLAGAISANPAGVYMRQEGSTSKPISGEDVLDLALRNLDSIDLVGFVDQLDDVYARVAAAFGLPRIARLPRLNTRHEQRAELEAVDAEPMTPEIDTELDRLTSLDRPVFLLSLHHRCRR